MAAVWCRLLYYKVTLYENCPYSKFFWSVYSRIRTEYWGIRSISPYLVQMWKNTDQKNSDDGHFSRSAALKFRANFLKNLQKIVKFYNIFCAIAWYNLTLHKIQKFHLISWCENAQFLHQKIRWNYNDLCSVID